MRCYKTQALRKVYRLCIGSARVAAKRTGSAQALRGLPQNVQTANDHIHLPRSYSLRQLAANCNNTPKKKIIKLAKEPKAEQDGARGSYTVDAAP